MMIYKAATSANSQPIKSKDEQIILFKKFKALLAALGDLPFNQSTVANIAKYNPVLVREALNARERLLKTNLRVVIKEAERRANDKVSKEDLIQVGCDAVLKAMLRFDDSLNTKFSSYAFFWIRQSMIEESLRSSLIRTPKKRECYKIQSLDFQSDQDCSLQERIEAPVQDSIYDRIYGILSPSDKEFIDDVFGLNGKSSEPLMLILKYGSDYGNRLNTLLTNLQNQLE